MSIYLTTLSQFFICPNLEQIFPKLASHFQQPVEFYSNTNNIMPFIYQLQNTALQIVQN